MLNMQNVKDIEITEGNVRTIHDKDNRLIWGRLAYDTKYDGDTIQDGTPTPDAPVAVQAVTGEQTVTITGKNICSECKTTLNGALLWFKLPVLNFNIITLSCTLNEALNKNSYALFVDGTVIPLGTWRTEANVRFGRPITFTNEQMSLINNSSDAWIRIYKTGASFAIPDDAMIEYGSSMTNFEPYQSQSYTVNLGSTELCKIGDYQDYIYKSGDDWYVHKEIDKVVYDGDENESWTYQSQYHRCYISRPSNMGSTYQNYATTTKCDYFIAGDTTGSQDGVYYIGSTTISFKENTIITSASNWKTWLSSNNVTVYYDKTSSSDTQITDAALIAQLDAIHQFLTRYGYNSNVTGNLPIIINQTSL